MITLAGCTCSAKHFGFKSHIGLVLPMDNHASRRKLGGIILRLHHWQLFVISFAVIYSTLQFLFISCHTSISIVYYMLVLHASSPNPWQLACRFQSPQRARVMSPQVQPLALPLSAPPWQAGFVLHILKLALNPNGSTLSLPVQSIHGHHHS